MGDHVSPARHLAMLKRFRLFLWAMLGASSLLIGIAIAEFSIFVLLSGLILYGVSLWACMRNATMINDARRLIASGKNMVDYGAHS